MTYRAELIGLLSLIDGDAEEFVVGEAAIAKLAGFKKPRYFAERHMSCVERREVLQGSIVSQFTPTGHFYFCRGEVLTHPSSGSAWGENISRERHRVRQAMVPGWHNASADVNAEAATSIDLGPSKGGYSFQLVGEPITSDRSNTSDNIRLDEKKLQKE
jgi:hypothetical protein